MYILHRHGRGRPAAAAGARGRGAGTGAGLRSGTHTPVCKKKKKNFICLRPRPLKAERAVEWGARPGRPAGLGGWELQLQLQLHTVVKRSTYSTGRVVISRNFGTLHISTGCIDGH